MDLTVIIVYHNRRCIKLDIICRFCFIVNIKCAIMVLENGEIIERGTHEELLEKKGRYFELYTGLKELD